jgi:3-deoxy-D-manno-octulosonic-acid transferase
LRATIFEFCSVTLEMRLINKKFSTLVLEKIHSIRFKEDIDEPSFNKLAMWAVNVQGRMKNIRSITLKDKHEEQELKPNRAKTLKFG